MILKTEKLRHLRKECLEYIGKKCENDGLINLFKGRLYYTLDRGIIFENNKKNIAIGYLGTDELCKLCDAIHLLPLVGLNIELI